MLLPSEASMQQSPSLQLTQWDATDDHLPPPPSWEVKLITELLALFLVGLSSWLLVSGSFAAAVWEIEAAPEGSALFAHLDVAVQAPNVVPAVLVLCSPPGFIMRHTTALSAAILAIGVFGAGSPIASPDAQRSKSMHATTL